MWCPYALKDGGLLCVELDSTPVGPSFLRIVRTAIDAGRRVAEQPIERVLGTHDQDVRLLLFQVSRCGSTWFAESLRAASVATLGEPTILVKIAEHRPRWLGGVAATLTAGRPSMLRLTPNAATCAPRFLEAFPEALPVLLVRRPDEVAASLVASPSRWVGQYGRIGLAIAAVIDQAIDSLPPHAVVVDYRDLNGFITAAGNSCFDVEAAPSSSHSKTGGRFVPDSLAKRRSAPGEDVGSMPQAWKAYRRALSDPRRLSGSGMKQSLHRVVDELRGPQTASAQGA